MSGSHQGPFIYHASRLHVVPVKPGKNSIFLKNGKMVICRYSTGGKSGNSLDLE